MRSILYLAIVLLVSVPAAAQRQVSLGEEVNPSALVKISMLPDGNMSVAVSNMACTKLVQVIAEAAFGYNVVWRDQIPREAISVNLVNIDPNDALNTILNKVGYTFNKDDGNQSIVVELAEKAEPSPPPSPYVTRRQAAEDMANRYPGAYERDGTIGSYAQANALNDELWWRNNRAPMGYSGGYRDYGYRGYDDYRYSGYVLWKGCLTGPAGYIKFKYLGGRRERHLWYIYVNGEVIGSIDQGDSFFNQVDVCAASTLITIEKLGTGRWENRYSIRPGTLTEIGVGDFLPLKK